MGNLYAVVGTHWVTQQNRNNNDWTRPLVGDDCDHWLSIMRDSSQLHIVAWGFIGDANPQRTLKVKSMFPELYHLGISKDGQPKHPLYLPANTKPVLWE